MRRVIRIRHDPLEAGRAALVGSNAERQEARLTSALCPQPAASPPRDWCVCVPARNEAARLGALLDALATQDVDIPARVVIALNNTTDDSAEIVRQAADRHPSRLSIVLDDHVFSPDLAHAGSARARAMTLGAGCLEQAPSAVLISTDADSRPPADWIRRNLEAIDRGADLVGGRLVIDDVEPLEPRAAQLRALWDLYWDRVRAIEDAVDPSPCDPAPHHGDHTGASLAITVAAYTAAGGVPIVETGEDRALVNAAVAAGCRLVHPIPVWTRVSPRMDGRAVGGMAADMRRLQADAVSGRYPAAPAFVHWRDRALWRRKHRDRLGPAGLVAAEDALPPMPHDMPLLGLLVSGGAS